MNRAGASIGAAAPTTSVTQLTRHDAPARDSDSNPRLACDPGVLLVAGGRPFLSAYRDWFAQTEELLGTPDIPDDAWFSIRDEHERIGYLIQAAGRRP